MATDALVGKSVSHYRITRQLGSGGMGVVYEAEDTHLGRHVAVKILSEELQREPSILERFQREARAASTLNHPGICTVHSIEQHDGQHFIVMELLEGQTLAKRIGRQALDLTEVLDLGIQIADALESAHSKGIIHRDLKPVNLILNSRGQIKILDFGLAKISALTNYLGAAGQDSRLETSVDRADLTVAGMVLGTVHYMSPEQARGQLTDARTDLFSLGAILYQMVTGELPFQGDTQAIVFDAILNRDPPVRFAGRQARGVPLGQRRQDVANGQHVRRIPREEAADRQRSGDDVRRQARRRHPLLPQLPERRLRRGRRGVDLQGRGHPLEHRRGGGGRRPGRSGRRTES